MDKKTYFISYTNRAPEDVQWAKWVEWVLRVVLDQNTIMQEYDFHPGDNFKERMHNALQKADCVISILTHTYMQSTLCTKEWTNADWFVPIKFDNCKPIGLLKSSSYIDLYGLDKEAAQEKLIAGLMGSDRPIYEPDFPVATSTASYTAQDPEPHYPVFPMDNLPDRNPYFIGREDILKRVRTALQDSKKASLVGTGGFGKSAIAIEYAYGHATEYEWIWLVNAESRITLEQDLREFAFYADMALAGTEDFSRVLQFVLRWQKEHDKWLFIYDNAEGLLDALNGYLPKGHIGGDILVCTRSKQGAVGEILELGTFSPEEAIAFIQSRIKGASDSETQELADLLGHLPLALEHAASYIIETKGDCAEYIGLFKKHGLKVLDQAAKTINYEKTITTTWLISMEKIPEDSAARQLFNLCAYCAPDNIPLSLFKDGLDGLPQPLQDVFASGDELALFSLVEELTRYSLLSSSRDENGNTFLSMHRLIQSVVNHQLSSDTNWLSYCLDVAYSAFDYEYGDIQSMAAFVQNAPHIFEIARHTEKHFSDDNKTQEKIGWLYNTSGYGFSYSGSYSEALEYYKKALAICEKKLGKEHPDTATTYNNIASVYQNQGDYGQALEWFNKALAINEKVLGKEHPNTATSYNNIASVYKAQGDYGQALKYYGKALAIREKVLGEGHPDTATTYNNIASVYKSQGDYGQALEYYGKTLAIREKVLGEGHPDTATSYNNIAMVYRNQGDYGRALEFHKKALVIYEKVLGKEHPNTATSYNNIAMVYQDQGDYGQALEYYGKALEIRKKVLGKGHPDTAMSYNNIAMVCLNQGDYGQALEWHKKALAIREKVLGREHPNTATSYNNIASIYKSQGDYVKALEYSKKALAICEEVLGKEHPTTITTRENLKMCAQAIETEKASS